MLIALIVVMAAGSIAGFFYLNKPKAVQKKAPDEQRVVDKQFVCTRYNSINDAVNNIDTACILDLSGNNLSSLPSDITKLKNLTTIILNKNSFTAFPDELSKMPGLVEIRLSDNLISDFPASLSKLEKLQILDLSNNKISSIPGKFALPQKLLDLNLQGNGINTEDQEMIKNTLPNTSVTF